MMDSVSQEMQLLAVVAIGLLGFLAVLALSKVSARPISQDGKKVTIQEPSSPRMPSTPIEKKVGSVMTPVGRRSARLAKNRRKED
eukprot:CAMPEP_0198115972 /NCGR_PEP_ID=MMETSP1442-20131203/8744_1 /TAXON_ID= /ORGANISM="Craspedostauros australis, Strain CCMP3328" /LENGTH=84 /DNA_ID=CAMNT_0043773621 /DNA_START=198 /DNA_END=452 /DNA_ORIENTATION=-